MVEQLEVASKYGEIYKICDTHKEKGNEYFKACKYGSAIDEYTEAIDISLEHDDVDDYEPNPSLPTYYSNRAICHIKLENFGSAVMDATSAIAIDPNMTKAYFRRGCAYFSLCKYAEAHKDLLQSAKLNPKDKDCRQKLQECKKQIAAQKFALAIAFDRAKPVSETVKPEDMTVEESYKGPHYDKNGDLKAFATELLSYQANQKNLHRKYAYMLVLDCLEFWTRVPTLVDIDVPAGKEFTVCGDIHGQYYDLLNIFKINGFPSEENPYLFNGDFVDRGSFSVECILALMAFKMAYPNHMHLARGNHESKNLNKLYGFEGEVVSKYDSTLYDLFCEAFCSLPLAHVLNNKVFVTHGGLFSKDGVTLNDIRKTYRFQEPGDEGILAEILWSDPQAAPGRAPSKRGVGISFGPDVTQNFLQLNNLEMIVRSHEMKEEGYEKEHNNQLVTIFSAPNYCDQMGNLGAFMRFTATEKTITPTFTTFAHVEHPPIRAMQFANPALLGGFFPGFGK